MAHWLQDHGFRAYAVRGGVGALLGDASPTERGMPVEGTVPAPAGRALAALRHPRFRLYSAGVLLSLIGSWVESAAFGYVVLLLGGSAATLGVIGFLNTIPNIVFALPGGALADRYDRRKLLLIYQSANMGVAALLAVLWATGELTVPLIAAIAIVGGTLGTLSFPAFQGMLAATVPGEDLESAVAINSLSLQVARFVGPALAGFLLASGGPTWVFGANAASFVAVLAVLALLPSSRTTIAATASRVGGGIMDGLRFVLGRRSLASLMLLLVLAGMFGTPPVAFMIPAIVRFQLDAGAGTLGALTACIGLGSVLGSVALLALARRPNKGEPLLAGYFVTALAIAALGVSSSIPFSLAVAVVGGFCGVVFVGLSTVVVQAASPDAVRARAMAIWAAAFVGMLPFGGLITAGLAAWLGPGWAVTVDGLVVLVGGIAVLAWRPQVAWLGCAALPEACVAAVEPAAVAFETDAVSRA
ncbi:MAG: MFS transporter [Actinomycetota bacterium]|nr:MFS transporter [Actinomycetota bacterium]